MTLEEIKKNIYALHKRLIGYKEKGAIYYSGDSIDNIISAFEQFIELLDKQNIQTEEIQELIDFLAANADKNLLWHDMTYHAREWYKILNT